MYKQYLKAQRAYDAQEHPDYWKDDDEDTELTNQVRNHRLRTFNPVVILRKKDGREIRKEVQ